MVEDCREMVNIVKPLFGPRARLALVITPNNSVYLTSNCLLALKTVSQLNFNRDFILKSAISYRARFGDGSKTFLLILNEMLRQIRLLLIGDKSLSRNELASQLNSLLQNEINSAFKIVRESSHCLNIRLKRILVPNGNEIKVNSNNFQSLEQRCPNFNASLDLSQSFNEKTSNFDEKTSNSNPNFNQNFDKFLGIVKKLMDTFFAGKFSPLVSSILAEKFFEFLSNFPDLNFIQNNFNLLVNSISGCGVNETKIIPGFILKRNFVVYPRDFRLKCLGLNEIRFICVVEESNPNLNEIYSPKYQDEIILKTFQISEVLKQSFERLMKFNINLIVVKGKATQNLFNLCRKFEIGLICTTHPEEFDFILNIAEIEAISLGEVDSFARLKSIEPLMAGNNQWIRLEFQKPVYSLLIGGPNQLSASQYLEECRNGLKIILSSIESDQLIVYPSNAAWEINMAKILRKLTGLNGIRSKLIDAIAESLMIIPKTIYENSNRIESRYLNVELKMNSFDSVMIDHQTGQVRDLEGNINFESLAAKEALLNQVLTILIQILRLDLIIT